MRGNLGVSSRKRPGTCLRVVGLLFGALLLAGGGLDRGPAAAAANPPSPVPAKGMFLVASPDLADPNFRESVILICEHSPAGTLGLVINRPTNLLLSEALPAIAALQGTTHVLFAGGPVQPDAILMLFRADRAPADTRPVAEGIYIGGNSKLVEDTIAKPGAQARFRAFAGYAGWGPGQLAGEMAQGAWRLVPADPGSIFEKNPGEIWSSLGGRSVPTAGQRLETRLGADAFIRWPSASF